MTLEEFRIDRKLSYERLADLIDVSGASVARKYALGMRRPEADEIDRICKLTGGLVTPDDFHRARLAYLARNPAEVEPAEIEP